MSASTPAALADVLDRENFDAIAYLNDAFPTEQSLTLVDAATGLNRVESVLLRHREESVQISAHISKTLRDWSGDQERTRALLGACESETAQLLQRVTSIKQSAQQSEQLVHHICKDIKTLDVGKRNLVKTITMLKRFQMLQSGADQLDQMLAHTQYKPAAQLLQAMSSLLTDIAAQLPVSQWPQSAQKLHHGVQRCKEQLFLKILADFKSFMHDVTSSDQQSNNPTSSSTSLPAAASASSAAALTPAQEAAAHKLSEACMVLDVMGHGSKYTVFTWFAERSLDAYRMVFEPSAGNNSNNINFSLEHGERRFAWWRSFVLSFEQRWRQVFPSEWRILGRVCHQFCQMTSEHLTAILNAGKYDVAHMLRLLQLTLDWEEQHTRFFRRLYVGSTPSAAQSDSDGEDEPHSAPAPQASPTSQASPWHYDPQFAGSISNAFSPYLGAYVELERSNVRQLLEKIAQEEGWNLGPASSGIDQSSGASIFSALFTTQATAASNTASGTATVKLGVGYPPRFGGSDHLFMFIKHSLKRVTRVHSRSIFVDIVNVHKTAFRQFAMSMAQNLPSCRSMGHTSVAAAAAIANNSDVAAPEVAVIENELLPANVVAVLSWTESDAQTIPLRLADIKTEQLTALSVAVNTCEYCIETLPMLQETLDAHFQTTEGKSAQQSDSSQSAVTVDSEGEAFQLLLHKCMMHAVTCVAARLQRCWNSAMLRTEWSQFDAVGDVSQWMSAAVQSMQEGCVAMLAQMSTSYHNYFFTQLATVALPQFVAAVFKCRRPSDAGAQQLLLDAGALRSALNALPAQCASASAAVQAGTDSDDQKSNSGPVGGGGASFLRIVRAEFARVETALKTVGAPAEVLVTTYRAVTAATGATSSASDLALLLDLKGMAPADKRLLLDEYARAESNAPIATSASSPPLRASSLTASPLKPALSDASAPAPTDAAKKLFLLNL